MILNCNGQLLDLKAPIVMGIINANNESFYEGSRISEINKVVEKAKQFIEEGAAIIDLGVMSTRPGARIVNHEKEWQVLAPILEAVVGLDSIISIDTVWSETAIKSIKSGANIINDVSGGTMDSNMIPAVSKYATPYVMMHMVGTPQTMQNKTQYENLILDVLAFFKKQILLARSQGMKDIIIDPGFGFAKDLDQNYKLLKSLSSFKIFDLPILVGLSRKSMLYKYLDLHPESALNATTVANTIALMNGAKILRVHDVKEAVEAVKLVEKTYS
jgi:dihydropteroate synthase